MAKKKSATEELADRLHVHGIRRKVADTLAHGVGGARSKRKVPKNVRGVIDQLKAVTAELEDRAKGGPSKRSAAAKKGAATRKRRAARRSAAAKKGARTRATK